MGDFDDCNDFASVNVPLDPLLDSSDVAWATFSEKWSSDDLLESPGGPGSSDLFFSHLLDAPSYSNLESPF